MPNGLQLVVIDDNRASALELEVQLKFLGETPLMTTARDWKQSLAGKVESAKKIAVMIGEYEQTPLSTLIQSIHDWNSDTSIIMTGQKSEQVQYPEKSQSRVFELDKNPGDYRSLLSVLEKARKSGSSIISENGTSMFRSLVGESELMKNARDLMMKVAAKMSNVLILGESGTGKEILARNLHYHSGRGDKPFILVNCIAFSAERFSAELFGVEAGHQGHRDSRAGYIEKAEGGTLFLDEIGDMSLDIQGEIMSLLEHQCFERVGGISPIQADVRIVAATNKNLEEKISQGKFREDLYYRLSVVPITIPALNKRVEDLPDLIAELLERLAGKQKNSIQFSSIQFSSTAMISLQRHSWPGNVRELTNLIERLSIMHPNEIIGVSDLPREYQHINADERSRLEQDSEGDTEDNYQEGSSKRLPRMKNFKALNDDSLKQYLASFEKNIIDVALRESEGSLDYVRDRLQLEEEALNSKMELHSLI